MSATRGKLICIDGTDGSGKATQVDILYRRLQDEDYEVKMLDYPRYGKPSAYFVERYLNGDYGKNVSGKKGTLFYALDRFDEAEEVNEWIQRGGIWLSNRYVPANMGHQAGKAKTKKERDEILEFIETIEYNILGLAREDRVILLYMPPIVGQRLVDEKEKRSYTDKKRDIHEEDLDHLVNAADSYVYVANKKGWDIVNCLKPEIWSDEQMRTLPIEELVRTREDIHKEVYNLALKTIIN